MFWSKSVNLLWDVEINCVEFLKSVIIETFLTTGTYKGLKSFSKSCLYNMPL